MRTFRFILVLTVLITYGCDGTFNASRLDNELANSTWLFERAEAGGDVVDRNPDAVRRASITFGDRGENSTAYEVNGYNGCNIFSGNYSVDGENELQFYQIAQTEMACQAIEARIEEVFNRAILNAKTYVFDGEMLVIDAPGESVKLSLIRSVE